MLSYHQWQNLIISIRKISVTAYYISDDNFELFVFLYSYFNYKQWRVKLCPLNSDKTLMIIFRKKRICNVVLFMLRTLNVLFFFTGDFLLTVTSDEWNHAFLPV